MASLPLEILYGLYLGVLTGLVPALIAWLLGFGFKYFTGITIPGLGVVGLGVMIAGLNGGLLALADPSLTGSANQLRLTVALLVVLMGTLYAHGQGDKMGASLPRRMSLRELTKRTLSADVIELVGGRGQARITVVGDVGDIEGYPPLPTALREAIRAETWTFPADLPLAELESILDDDHEFEVATMVHCETPTGTLNDLGPALDLLEEADREILTVVDAVSSLGGVRVPTDRIDVCLGASQKCFSAPPGLTTAAISDRAWAAMDERDPHSLYTNFLPWRDVSEEFPYTHLNANVAALDVAVDRLLEEGLESVHDRHERAAERCRERVRELGLECYPDPERCSPTVTAVHLPGEARTVQRRVREEHDVVLATGLGEMADDVLRFGHMGYNADPQKVERAMDALADALYRRG